MFVKSTRVLAVALIATAGILTPAVVDAPAVAASAAAADSSVVTDWNSIAERTIFVENETLVPASGLYFSFVSIAMYDAVVAIEGGYETYSRQPQAPRLASPEVAAATAAYAVLRYYFPASADELRADYLATLAEAPKDMSLVQGVRVGAVAAATLIRSRQGDGIGAVVTLEVEPAPGVWRPTPDMFLPMAVPWLGFVDPLTLDSPTQMPLRGPSPLNSEAYARDFAETKAYGALVGSSRTAEETETALFFSVNVMSQYQAAMRDQVTRRGLDIVESSRAFALLNTAAADTLISCWRAKFDYPTWRPITAIPLADTDGNDATEADPNWLPLGQTPPYSEYASGHACITGATTNTLSYLFGADSIDLNLSSMATSTTRHYNSADALDVDTMNARIWLGLHFRDSMIDANQLGHDVSDWTIAHHFRPTSQP
jgi:hypothetical protein